ncbi:unnamed protein product [Prunus brigantina]
MLSPRFEAFNSLCRQTDLTDDEVCSQFAGVPFGFVISPGSRAISWDCVSPDLSNPFALMPIAQPWIFWASTPIIHLFEGLPKKSRSRPKKVRRVHEVPKRFCSGASSDKAKETALVESPRSPS